MKLLKADDRLGSALVSRRVLRLNHNTMDLGFEQFLLDRLESVAAT